MLNIFFLLLITVFLNGEVGVNYYDAFVRLVKYNDTSYKKGFKKLADNNISLIRINGGGFYKPKDWEIYTNDKKSYFKQMDSFIAEAEKNNIKIIFSMFWRYDAIPRYLNEHIKAYENDDSKTIKFIKQYIFETVNRYHNSKAIIMWEMGNEYNLKINLKCKKLKHYKKCTEKDILTKEAYRNIADEFIKSVNKYDKNRLISSGNSIPRSYIYTKKVTKKELKTILLNENKGFSILSLHLYPWNLNKRVYRKYFMDINDFITFIKQVAVENRQKVLVGEFGVGRIKDKENQNKILSQYLEAFHKNKIKYSLIWVFDMLKKQKYNINLDEFKSINRAI